MKATLILSALAGGSVILFWCYVNYKLGPMATANNELLDSLTGFDVIIISAALGMACCIVKFGHLRELDKSGLLQKSLSEFEKKTSQFWFTSQGILIAYAFTFLFWHWYTSACNLTKYQAADGSFQDFTGQNHLWLGLMGAAVVCAGLNLAAAKALDHWDKESKNPRRR